MYKAILLYSDRGLSTSLLPEAVCEYYTADHFNINKEIRSLLLQETPLSIIAKSALHKGQLISGEVLDSLIEEFIASSNPRPIVFSNYAFTADSFKRLVNTLAKHHYAITNILVFQQADPEDFMVKHFQEPVAGAYLEKYGEEVVENWKKLFTKRRSDITDVLENNWPGNYDTIKVTYEPNLSVGFFLDFLKGYAADGLPEGGQQE